MHPFRVLVDQVTQVRYRVMRGGNPQQHGWKYTRLCLENSFLEIVDSGKSSEFGFARSVAVARVPRAGRQKQMV